MKGWASLRKLTYPILIDPDLSVWNLYGMDYIPHNVVIDTTRVVRYTNYGYEEAEILRVINEWLPAATGVDDIPVENQPLNYALHQNYPNPFNPQTTINYELPSPEKVILEIINVTGNRIRTLVNSPMGTGRHSAVWDGRDESGRPVAAGVYLYTLKTGRCAVAKKLLLIR